MTARLIPNGIDIGSYDVGEKVPGRVVFLGRDDRRKGLDVLLDAWAGIHEAVPSSTLHVMGADRGDAPEGVTYLGRVSDTTKYAGLSAAEIFVAPNLGGESFGITVAEGMAAGCAVVASGIPAFLHVLADAGEIFAPGDAEGLRDAVIGIFNSDEKRVTLAEMATRRVQRFDGAQVAADYLAAYTDAIDKHRV